MGKGKRIEDLERKVGDLGRELVRLREKWQLGEEDFLCKVREQTEAVLEKWQLDRGLLHHSLSDEMVILGREVGNLREQMLERRKAALVVRTASQKLYSDLGELEKRWDS